MVEKEIKEVTSHKIQKKEIENTIMEIWILKEKHNF